MEIYYVVIRSVCHVFLLQAHTVLDDIVFDELDCDPADEERQKELLADSDSSDEQTLCEKYEEKMREVYSEVRVPAEGTKTPKQPLILWAVDNQRRPSRVNRLQIITPRNNFDKEYDIRKAVEERIKTKEEKGEQGEKGDQTRVKRSRSKVKELSPYAVI